MLKGDCKSRRPGLAGLRFGFQFGLSLNSGLVLVVGWKAGFEAGFKPVVGLLVGNAGVALVDWGKGCGGDVMALEWWLGLKVGAKKGWGGLKNSGICVALSQIAP